MIAVAFDTAVTLGLALLAWIALGVTAFAAVVIGAAWWLRHGTGRAACAARAFIRERVGELRPPWAGSGKEQP